jgi:hypothetical protein
MTRSLADFNARSFADRLPVAPVLAICLQTAFTVAFLGAIRALPGSKRAATRGNKTSGRAHKHSAKSPFSACVDYARRISRW